MNLKILKTGMHLKHSGIEFYFVIDSNIAKQLNV
jgi:hypothetical protein